MLELQLVCPALQRMIGSRGRPGQAADAALDEPGHLHLPCQLTFAACPDHRLPQGNSSALPNAPDIVAGIVAEGRKRAAEHQAPALAPRSLCMKLFHIHRRGRRCRCFGLARHARRPLEQLITPHRNLLMWTSNFRLSFDIVFGPPTAANAVCVIKAGLWGAAACSHH